MSVKVVLLAVGALCTVRSLVVTPSTPVVMRASPVWFGKYQLLERIAVGGMAEVFRAVRPGLEGFEKTLAIKRIRPHLSKEAAFISMFLDEARLAAQLVHPNIVQIFDLGRIGGSYFIAMEYVSGRDMARVVPKAEKMGIPFPIEYAMSIAASALGGLAYAHAKESDLGEPLNIVHRDITPENIMVGWNGNVKILDFGIAKAASQRDQTKAGELKGKLSYMSPEQGLGKQVDARSDLFALGVVLYEWITGYRMFTGENEMAILKSIIDGRIYPPSYFRDDVPAAVESILMRALAKDRDERYASARDMLHDVQQWLHQLPFTPSAIHLATFLEQIFRDERASERQALARQAEQKRQESAVSAPPIGEAVGRAKTPSSGEGRGRAEASLVVVREDDVAIEAVEESSYASEERVLSLCLNAGEYERLRLAAERAGESPELLVTQLVRAALKYF